MDFFFWGYLPFFLTTFFFDFETVTPLEVEGLSWCDAGWHFADARSLSGASFSWATSLSVPFLLVPTALALGDEGGA